MKQVHYKNKNVIRALGAIQIIRETGSLEKNFIRQLAEICLIPLLIMCMVVRILIRLSIAKQWNNGHRGNYQEI